MTSSEGSDHKGLRNMSRKSDDVAGYYDDWAEDYDRTLARWQYEAPEQAATRLRAMLDTDSVILDAGCGTGLSGKALVKTGFSVVDGIDVSQCSLEHASRLGIYRSLEQVDMQKLPLPFKDDSYDGLVCVGVLTYLPDSEGTLKEFCRIVRPGGAMVLTQRSDILGERDFPAVLTTLKSRGLMRKSHVSDPRPYLPENDEFGDEIQVHYIRAVVA
jgi:predicted TPR repeat methyltransferase